MGARPVALVTGASRGIGRAIALELAQAGYDIVGNAVTSPLEELGAQLEACGVEFAPAPGDITRGELHEALVGAAYEQFGRLDVFVSNAGIAPDSRRDILETTPESYDRVMAVNARGAFFLAQCAARRMLAGGGDGRSIVFISSISAVASSTSRAEYCMSKAALSQAARLFADRLAPHGITVFEVRPGIIRTDMTAAAAEKYDALIADGLVPQERWGEPQDVARAVRALVSGHFAYATGMVCEVSGGMDIRRL